MNLGTTASPGAVELDRARFDAAVFDLDGVITRTARLHALAWQQMFDAFLAARGRRDGVDHGRFDPGADYLRHVDGKPRADGVRDFVAARGLALPEGSDDDPAEAETVHGLGTRKDALFQSLLERHGADVHPHAIDLLRSLRAAGFRTAVVSASRNCVPILRSVGILDLFDARVDGVDAERRRLRGKPAPDTFLAAASDLGVAPARAVVFEDALAGVAAGRAGGFGLVVGVDRARQAKALRDAGADAVVDDLARCVVKAAPDSNPAGDTRPAAPAGARVPPPLPQGAELDALLHTKRWVVCLDYDGTLTPIVERPEQAVLDASMRDALERVATRCPVAVISGRDLEDVRARVGIERLWYAGSHGFEISGPAGERHENPDGLRALPALDAAEQQLRAGLSALPGVLVERKRYAIAVHFRLAEAAAMPIVESAVDAAHARHAGLRKRHGKKIFELQPDADWDKGSALHWLLDELGPQAAGSTPLYIGDDLTDEDAFRAIAEGGLGIVVLEQPRPSAAHWRVADPAAVARFLLALSTALERRP